MKNNKILVLTPRFPYPLHSGDKLRIFNICKYLKSQNFKLYLISFIADKKELDFLNNQELKNIFDDIEVVYLPKYISFLNSFCGLFSKFPIQVWYYKSKDFYNKINQKIKNERIDFVLVHLIRLAPYVFELKNVKKVLEMTDSLSYFYSLINKNNFFHLLKFIYQKIERKRVFEFEKLCIEKFDKVVVVSERDKQYLESNILNNNLNLKIKVITNGVGENFINCFEKNMLNNYDKNLCVFIGNMRSYQNQDAIFYFVKEILPLVRNKNKDFKFKIVGSGISNKMIKFFKKNRVDFTGKVENVIEHLKGACLSVAPIRIGAGVQNKILESMALAIPVVTTPFGLEGIKNCVPNKHLMVGNDKYDFCNKILELINNSNLRNEIALNGRNFILNFYQWEKVLKDYSLIFV